MTIANFSKLSKEEKIQSVLAATVNNTAIDNLLYAFETQDTQIQKSIESISENVISNFHLPYSIAPNFLINGKTYHIPMVIEESSVVAAASSAAKFWSQHGGFKTSVLATEKIGQVHFTWDGAPEALLDTESELATYLTNATADITASMIHRGGGITAMKLLNLSNQLPHYYQLLVSFETADAMGANFINTCLEKIAESLQEFIQSKPILSQNKCSVTMAILSNHTPNCVVTCTVSCNIADLAPISGILSPDEFARKFELAVAIANTDIYRATTHNKGIMNGIDAAAIATGNDFRAIEAGAHAFAARSGKYQSLSSIHIGDNIFTYTLTIPLSVGTVGGLTKLHLLAKTSLEILGNPSAKLLMQIIAAAGMANNFSAVKSLITSGIQKGHMKLHLNNILQSIGANDDETLKANEYFSIQPVSYQSVKNFITEIRK